MEIRNMTTEDIKERAEEIEEEIEKEDANVDELEAEVEELEEQKEKLENEAEERKKKIAKLESTTKEVRTFEKEGEKNIMNLKEVRNSKDYINAYAEWLKHGDDKEIRTILSELAPEESVTENDSVFPVPTYLEERIKTAWDKDEIARRVPRTYVKGVYKIGFELSATDAVVHAEGSAAPDAEKLEIGVVTLNPESIKKWIKVSDEVLDLKGEAFLDYLFDEIEYKIAHKAVGQLINDMKSLPAASTAEKPAAAAITEEPGHNTILNAMVTLSDEATKPVVIMNKQTYGIFKGLSNQLGLRYEDVFEGLEVLFNNDLPTYTAANTNDVYAIVVDLDGTRFNFPNGGEVTFKYDDTSLAELDLVKIVGRMYVAHGVIAPNFVALIKKPAGE